MAPSSLSQLHQIKVFTWKKRINQSPSILSDKNWNKGRKKNNLAWLNVHIFGNHISAGISSKTDLLRNGTTTGLGGNRWFLTIGKKILPLLSHLCNSNETATNNDAKCLSVRLLFSWSGCCFSFWRLFVAPAWFGPSCPCADFLTWIFSSKIKDDHKTVDPLKIPPSICEQKQRKTWTENEY